MLWYLISAHCNQRLGSLSTVAIETEHGWKYKPMNISFIDIFKKLKPNTNICISSKKLWVVSRITEVCITYTGCLRNANFITRISHIYWNETNCILTDLRYHTYVGDIHPGTVPVTLGTYVAYWCELCRLFLCTHVLIFGAQT